MTEPIELLRGTKTVELIDWPNAEVPAALARAGLTVVAPRHPPRDDATPYVLHEVVAGKPALGVSSYPLADGSHLTFPPLEERPDDVGIVCTFRPAEEQPAIVAEAARQGARVLWIEPGETVSDEARQIAKAAGLEWVEGVSIADVARQLLGSR